MPKDSKINKKGNKGKKPGGGSPGKNNKGQGKAKGSSEESEYKKIKKKAQQSRRKKATVHFPALIPGRDYSTGNPPEEEPMTEAEISYKDKLLSVELGKLAKKGLNDTEIIKALGMARSTFYDKVNENPYFSYILYKYRGLAKDMVESALYNTALGFKYVEQVATPAGIILAVQKQALPNVGAQRTWLFNRAPEEWKHKVETTIVVGAGMERITFSLKPREE